MWRISVLKTLNSLLLVSALILPFSAGWLNDRRGALVFSVRFSSHRTGSSVSMRMDRQETLVQRRQQV